MPLLEHDKAIREYYEQVKDKYPDINFEEFRVICRTPFEFIKSLIKSVRLPIIMVKYLGKFTPSIKRVKEQLSSEAVYFAKGITDQQEYERRRNYLQNFINDYDNEPEKELLDDLEEGETSD